MEDQQSLNQPQLETILRKAMASGTSSSLRAEGEVKLMGNLHVRSLVAGASIQLEGAKLRDVLPPPGTAVTLTLILGEQVISLRTHLLEPITPDTEPKVAPILQAAWPTGAPEIHARGDVRVATPDLPPLEATLLWQGRSLEAKLLNLTDMGMGLGLEGAHDFQYHERVDVITSLPGSTPLRVTGEVRHAEALVGDELPTRVGLVLVDLPPETRETLQSFIQARRMDRSFLLRGER